MTKKIIVSGFDDQGNTANVDVVVDDNGSAHVVDVGLQRPSHNREFSSVSTLTRQSVTWPEGFGPREIEIVLSSGDAYVVFDAPNDQVADDWLADGGGVSLDAMRYYVADETIKPTGNVYKFSGELSRMDIIAITATIPSVHVEAE